MPIYEYECPRCGKFEAVQKASEKPLKADPDCKHGDCPRCAKKVISAAAFHLKGGGWYKTDYGSSGSSAATSGSSDSSSSGDSDSSGKKKADKADSKKDGKKAGSCGPSCGCH